MELIHIIGTHEHESHYVFDLLYNNTSEIRPTRHSTDTHGTNHVNFWTLRTFGYGFAPRYKDLRKKTASLVSFEAPSSYAQDVLIRPSSKVDTDLIIREWPNIQRIMASLAQKDTTQATIVRKLSSVMPIMAASGKGRKLLHVLIDLRCQSAKFIHAHALLTRRAWRPSPAPDS